MVTSVRSVVSTLQYGISAKAEADAKGGVAILRMGNIQNGRLDLSDLKYVPRSKDLVPVRLRRGDILFNRTNSPALVGKSAIFDADDELVFASYLIRITTRLDAIEPKYLCWWINSAWGREWASRVKTDGVSQSNINGTKLGEMPIPLAPLNEQHRIAEKVEALLEQVNRAKERLDRVPLILKRFRHAVLEAACSGELTREWRQNHRGEHSALNLVRNIWEERGRSARRSLTLDPPVMEEVKQPEGWCETRIGDLVDCLDHLRKPINKEERTERTGSIPYFGANGQVGWIDSHLFDEDLVLVVEDETFIGREKPFSYIIRGKSWVNNHAHVLRPLGGISADYLDSCLAFYNFVPLTSGTTGRRKLTRAALIDAPLRVAPLAEQQEIVRRKTALFALAATIERRVQAATARANKLSQAILSEAFSGELVPTEAELARLEGRTYETAEELLKRVMALGSDAPSKGKGRGRQARKEE